MSTCLVHKHELFEVKRFSKEFAQSYTTLIYEYHITIPG